jgi:hypothetical protein
MKFQKLFLPILFLLISVTSYGQDDDIFGIAKKPKIPKSESSVGNATRNLIEMFSMEVSGGSAFHQIKMPFYSTAPTLYPLYQVSDLGNQLVLAEENPLNLKGNKYSLPISAGFRINFFNILTAGLTYGQEYGKIGPLKENNQIFLFDGTTYKATKLYLSGGLIVWDAMKRAKYLNWRYRNFSSSNRYMQSELRQRVRQYYPWRVVLEGDYGFFFMRETFDPRVEVSEAPFVGYGIRLERDLSEYAKLFVKGSMEKREFTFSASNFSEVQNFGQNYFGIQMGLAFVLPGTQRCPIKGCGVVMKHAHNGIEFRGSSIFKFQNRKIGQWR